MTKNSTAIDWYSAEISQNATFQQEMHHHWSTLCQDLKDKPSSLSDAFILENNDHRVFNFLYSLSFIEVGEIIVKIG
jgi:hypothetical protein